MADSPGLFTLLPTFYRSLTIDHTQVPSTQTNFPVLVNFTNATFKSRANAGHVNNSFGYDIGFFSDSAGTSPLKWEMERYNAATGEVVASVKIASVSSASDTVFYMRYGGQFGSNQSDPVNVWTNSFKGVYHLRDGTNLSAADSLNAFNGSITGAAATTGQIDGGAIFVAASSQFIGTTMNGVWDADADTTIECWFKTTAVTGVLMGKQQATASAGWLVTLIADGTISVTIRGPTGTTVLSRGTSTAVNDGAWRHLVVTFHINTAGTSGQDIQIYVNGVLNQGALTNTSSANSDSAANVYFARREVSASPVYYDGSLDEIRIQSAVARSADWVTCVYNNQKTGSTFVTLGAET